MAMVECDVKKVGENLPVIIGKLCLLYLRPVRFKRGTERRAEKTKPPLVFFIPPADVPQGLLRLSP